LAKRAGGAISVGDVWRCLKRSRGEGTGKEITGGNGEKRRPKRTDKADDGDDGAANEGRRAWTCCASMSITAVAGNRGCGERGWEEDDGLEDRGVARPGTGAPIKRCWRHAMSRGSPSY